ncbi:HAD family hydrolase [Actinoalloteichus spitiensis]|uniref:HAD family hydrolase n=1 Tax=Actinoalloteichus spitiensis TaxID=252394 RepID=UPI0003760385|nr:HAD family hydrolase [Actinoalloteichus spitiensis]
MDKPGLVASDVDGTLLDPLEQLRPRTASVITRVLDAAILVVLATGRSPRWVYPVARALRVGGLAVCVNGAVILDVERRTVLRTHAMDPPLLHDVAGVMLDALPGCALAVEQCVDAGSPQHPPEDDTRGAPVPLVGDGYQSPRGVHRLSPVPLAELLGRPAVRMIVRHPALSSREMARAVGPLVSDAVEITYSTDEGLIDVMRAGVNKAIGLAEVADLHGVDQADVVAFGDMPNDIPMLRWAGHGVAMENAHPDVLAAADETTASNAEDGVARVLERWF